MIFEEYVVAQEKWQRSYSWQMTLRLQLSEPLCDKDQVFGAHGPNAGAPLVNKMNLQLKCMNKKSIDNEPGKLIPVCVLKCKIPGSKMHMSL